MINVVIPMAGRGSRFFDAGYKNPKPFIEINNKTLIEIVLDNLSIVNAHYYLLAQREHLITQSRTIKRISDSFRVTFIPIDKITEGAACTVLHAHRFINNDNPLLLANSDQFIQSDINDYIIDCLSRKLDGSILTFNDKGKNPKWSFAKLDEKGLVVEVKEKQPISENASVGIYYFSKGRYFVESALDMIVANERVNGEFYTCPVYNYCIKNGLKIGIYNIPTEFMHGLGTPDDLNVFLNKGICLR